MNKVNATTLEEALSLPFDAYMVWCHDWCRNHARDNPIFQDVYLTSQFSLLEANWAKRYWFHHCNIIGSEE